MNTSTRQFTLPDANMLRDGFFQTDVEKDLKLIELNDRVALKARQINDILKELQAGAATTELLVELKMLIAYQVADSFELGKLYP